MDAMAKIDVEPTPGYFPVIQFYRDLPATAPTSIMLLVSFRSFGLSFVQKASPIPAAALGSVPTCFVSDLFLEFGLLVCFVFVENKLLKLSLNRFRINAKMFLEVTSELHGGRLVPKMRPG